MSIDIEKDLQNYYHSYCELTIWFKKLVLHSDSNVEITIQDVFEEFIAERDRILRIVPQGRRKTLRKELNKIIVDYRSKITHWSREQKLSISMV
jgi:hypothetical protein